MEYSFPKDTRKLDFRWNFSIFTGWQLIQSVYISLCESNKTCRGARFIRKATASFWCLELTLQFYRQKNWGPESGTELLYHKGGKWHFSFRAKHQVSGILPSAWAFTQPFGVFLQLPFSPEQISAAAPPSPSSAPNPEISPSPASSSVCPHHPLPQSTPFHIGSFSQSLNRLRLPQSWNQPPPWSLSLCSQFSAMGPTDEFVLIAYWLREITMIGEAQGTVEAQKREEGIREAFLEEGLVLEK